MSKSNKWATIVYPESAPQDWEEILEMTMISSAISPLHDKDIDMEGNIKKPHYHVMMVYDGNTTYNHALEIAKSIGGVGLLRIESIRGYHDYLTHRNNPKKHQYDSSCITYLNGMEDKIAKADKDNPEILNAIMDNIKTYKIYSYALLCDIYRRNPQYNQVIIGQKVHLLAYMRSLMRLRDGQDNPDELKIVDGCLVDGDGVIIELDQDEGGSQGCE